MRARTMEFFTPTDHHEVYPFLKLATKDTAKGKTVIITGASRGIGQAVAEAFAYAGAKALILIARSASSLSATQASIASISADIQTAVYGLDVHSSEAVAQFFSDIKDGKLSESTPDVLVNNAGITEAVVPLGESKPDMWWGTWEANVKGTYLTCREFVKMLDGKEGTIINTSSFGSCATLPGLSGYQSTKTAVNRVTEFIDAEYREKGIKCICYHPGNIKTELSSNLPEGTPQWVLDLFIDSPQLAGSTCVYLTSDRSDFLRGRYVSANWNMEELEAMKEEIEEKDLLKTRVVIA